MTREELKVLSKEEIRDYIDAIWTDELLWDGTAGNAYVSVEVLGATLNEVKEALVVLIKDLEDEEVIEMLEDEDLWLHEDSLADDGCVSMAYWKGSIDFAYTLSKVLPDALVVCNDGGWYGVDECTVAKKGTDAIPGVDYKGDMQYCFNPDFTGDDEDEEEIYYEVNLQIIDHEGNMTCVGGGLISEEDTEHYKAWANKVKRVKDINWDRNSRKC